MAINEEMKKTILQWFSKADEDLRAVERLYADDATFFAGIIGFHCQQCIEKYLKAFIIYKEAQFKKIHDLDMLKKECISIDNDFKELNFKNLTDYAIDFRYLHDDNDPEVGEISYFINVARQTKSLVRSKIIIE